MTELLYLRDAYLTTFSARVTGVRDAAIALDRTAFYPTGGGQPYDTGVLAGLRVTEVRKESAPVEGDVEGAVEGAVWHTVEGAPLPAVGDVVEGTIDWERRHHLMRTHTALHVLCGVIWNEWKVPVTGGNMEPLSARMDFEFDPLPEGFGPRVEALVNDALVHDHPIEVTFAPSETTGQIRTKENRVPQGLSEVRLVDIVGLDQQADGGTHVRSTAEVGRVRITKVENKGKGNKRVRLVVEDA